MRTVPAPFRGCQVAFCREAFRVSVLRCLQIPDRDILKEHLDCLVAPAGLQAGTLRPVDCAFPFRILTVFQQLPFR